LAARINGLLQAARAGRLIFDPRQQRGVARLFVLLMASGFSFSREASHSIPPSL
jgi:hypothetical protein